MRNFIIKLVWYDDIGRGKVMGRAFGILSQAAMFFTFLRVYGVSLKVWQMIVFAITYLLIEVICGIIYIKLGLLKIETELSNKQNPTLTRIECATKKEMPDA